MTTYAPQDDLRAALLMMRPACSTASTMMIVSGRILNEWEGSGKYEPSAAYYLTESGIARIEDGE